MGNSSTLLDVGDGASTCAPRLFSCEQKDTPMTDKDTKPAANPAPTPASAPAFSEGATEAAAKDAKAQKPTVAHMPGEVTWLFSQSPTHKHFAPKKQTGCNLEWMVMPPPNRNGLLEQYRVFRGDAAPVGVAFWAYLSEEAEAKLQAGGTRLRPDEWKSGDRLWLVDFVAPAATSENKQTEAMLADLVKNVFGGKKFRFHRTDPTTGKRETVELGDRN